MRGDRCQKFPPLQHASEIFRNLPSVRPKDDLIPCPATTAGLGGLWANHLSHARLGDREGSKPLLPNLETWSYLVEALDGGDLPCAGN